MTYRQSCKLLNPEGAQLIRQGGKYDVMLDTVYLGDYLFRLNVDRAVATITLKADARKRLHINCTQCEKTCEHIGAAFSLILEEKTALGLASPPPKRVPVESHSEMDILRLQKALLMCRMAANNTFLVNKQAPGYSSKLEQLDELFAELVEQSTGKTVLFSE